MERIQLNQDIHPLSEFRSNASGFLSQIRKTKRPLVITQNGKSAAVLIDIDEYERLVDKLELIEEIEIAVNQITEQKGIGHIAAHKLVRERFKK